MPGCGFSLEHTSLLMLYVLTGSFFIGVLSIFHFPWMPMLARSRTNKMCCHSLLFLFWAHAQICQCSSDLPGSTACYSSSEPIHISASAPQSWPEKPLLFQCCILLSHIFHCPSIMNCTIPCNSNSCFSLAKIAHCARIVVQFPKADENISVTALRFPDSNCLWLAWF